MREPMHRMTSEKCLHKIEPSRKSRPFIVHGFRSLIERVIRIKYCLPYFSSILAEEFRSLLSSLKWSRALSLMYKKVRSTHPEITSTVNSIIIWRIFIFWPPRSLEMVAPGRRGHFSLYDADRESVTIWSIMTDIFLYDAVFAEGGSLILGWAQHKYKSRPRTHISHTIRGMYKFMKNSNLPNSEVSKIMSIHSTLNRKSVC